MGFNDDSKMECGTSISVHLAAVCAILAVPPSRELSGVHCTVMCRNGSKQLNVCFEV